MLQNAKAIHNRVKAIDCETWEEANARGRAAAELVVQSVRQSGNPARLGFAVKEIILKGVFEGYEVGYMHVIGNALLQ